MTGLTASSKDFVDVLMSRAPIVFAFVLGLAFILLLVTFRSIVVPIKAIVLNLLSVGAAYGVLVLVFQDGHGEKLLDFQSVGGIAPWIPLFLFVILFGLSMDYHVFILSRIREAVDRGMSNDDAVAHGIKSTAGVVTSAALVMVAVFGSFALASDQLAKQIGVGLAAAILIDATIIRAVLLPATMKLLGERNWYLPKRLGWLPKFEHEPQAAPSPPDPPGRRPGSAHAASVRASRVARDPSLPTPPSSPDVADLCVAAYAPFLAGDGAYVAVLRDVARRAAEAELLVAVEPGGGGVLGTVTFVPDGGALGEIAGPDEAEFRMLAVGPAAQGRGVGTALLRRVLDDSRRGGKQGVVCSSLPVMRAAHRIYEPRRLRARARARLVAGAGGRSARVRDPRRALTPPARGRRAVGVRQRGQPEGETFY